MPPNFRVCKRGLVYSTTWGLEVSINYYHWHFQMVELSDRSCYTIAYLSRYLCSAKSRGCYSENFFPDGTMVSKPEFSVTQITSESIMNVRYLAE